MFCFLSVFEKLHLRNEINKTSKGLASCIVYALNLEFLTEYRKMGSLDATRAELGLVVLYLNKAEARDKICRAIQYGSKFISKRIF